MAEPMVLIVVPVFDAADTVARSLESITSQKYKSIRIVAVDDASADESTAVLERLARRHERLTVLRLDKNVGTYMAANYGLMCSEFSPWEYFAIHGADDVMHRSKLQLQVAAMQRSGQPICVAGYERRGQGGEVLTHKLHGDSMAVYARRVLDDVGYYDNTRIAGDSEYYRRCLRRYGAAAECRVQIPLTSCGEGKLTRKYPLDGSDRSSYVAGYMRRHAAGDLIRPSGWTESDIVRSHGKKLFGGVATIRRRMESLRVTVSTVLPQLDRIVVYQNDYDETPDFLRHPKIEVISGLRTGVDMGDAGKFWAVDRCGPCIYFSLDDDLVYPADYVTKTLRCLRKHGGQVIVTSHGRNLRPDATSYYRDAAEYYPAIRQVAGEHCVQFGGTGVMAFDPAVVGVAFSDFKAANMADIWMGLHARRRGIPLVVFPHEAGWIRMTNLVPHAETIWATSQRDHSVQDSLIAGFDKSLVLRP